MVSVKELRVCFHDLNITTRTTIGQILRVPTGEIAFAYPKDARLSQTDTNPYPEGWRPHIITWQRYAATERVVQDLYGLTLIHRVNVVLDAAVPGRLSIIGTRKLFSSWGTDTSRLEGEKETKIAPDWIVVDGDAKPRPFSLI
ncbi:Uu.00g098830.m01.CDS01 [Anthostomella pinea]|uniref:Uu.00g098830.m01.CDS01 n=1 Tax=Anthostomella pinea TaxID=933095 RepID=A0AAI8VCP0_9PEZI|nr:Uu.00g098830.m01.CDS01 [Anthostomella pinea]